MTKRSSGAVAVKGAKAPPKAVGPRRSALMQERSRRTRRDLVRAALALWSQRGFETGVEETTVEEIAQAAGVTKGTFYFHFARKEDILLELGWGAGDGAFAAAEAGIAAGIPSGQLLDALLVNIASHVGRAPRAAVARSVSEFYRRPPTAPASAGRVRHGFRHAFAEVIKHGRERGEFPDDVDPTEIGDMLEAVVTEAIMRWARGHREPLINLLRRYAGVVAAGASGLFVIG
jgi:AcrR family transcriptional regulator